MPNEVSSGEGKTLTYFGMVAFESYKRVTENKNVRGEDIPEWDELPEKIQLAWIQAAVSARRGYV